MSEKESKRDEKEVKDRPTVVPEPADVATFEFFSSLFTADSMPQIIELRQAFGQGGRTYSEAVIWQKEFRQNTVPSQTEVIELVNKFLDIAQRNCDELGRATGYGFLFKNHLKSDKYYAVWYKKLSPKSRYVDADGDAGGEDDIVSDAKRRDTLLAFSLDHMRESDLNERWRQEQFAKSVGDIIGKYQEMLSMSMNHNLHLMQHNRELVKQNDEAQSHKLERELAAKKEEFRMQMLHDGFNFLKGMVPVAVNQITGKQTIPTADTTESLGIRAFLDSLSKQQAEQLFGELDASGQPDGNGIFTAEQTQIFAGVASNQMPPSMLDQLFDGPLAIQGEQVVKAQSVVSQQQIMPLMGLIMSMKKKQFDGGSSS